MERPILNQSAVGNWFTSHFSAAARPWRRPSERAGYVWGWKLDPKFVDVAVQRWQTLTGQRATLDGDGRSFASLREQRLDAATEVR